MILGVDAAARHDEDADHLAHLVREVVGRRLGPTAADRAVVATHEIRTGAARSAVSCTVDEPAAAGPEELAAAACATWSPPSVELLPPDGAVAATSSGLADGVWHGTDLDALQGAWTAVAAAATGTSGRLVHFRGAEELTGRLRVADVLASSAVQEVVMVGGAPHSDDTVLDTGGFVRPRLEGGRVRLLVQPGAGGVLVPFERENPHRCCEDH